ncbi:uncharacterized protein DNG_03324 [Cephalotrichum gorgonifer]|uniref:Uncharacterized protein n=1 Tax=Cephalotrichum gorgonifer TaxID=2041049 RepID=A0AAE8MVQ9_9PEZI|nr:uncharacterized protein DNG_03324 [Cephalotrichum gorgonifer]
MADAKATYFIWIPE